MHHVLRLNLEILRSEFALLDLLFVERVFYFSVQFWVQYCNTVAERCIGVDCHAVDGSLLSTWVRHKVSISARGVVGRSCTVVVVVMVVVVVVVVVVDGKRI
jgi:hypothetical protein|tara:strand:- start:172 stop:477 length:306 start_codon:yes stop_codon:yes gene_type:complete